MIKTKFLKCNDCGLVAEVVVPCHCEPACTMVCCDKTLQPLNENTTDGAKEKHVPYAIPEENGTRVQIGTELHPATEEHHIVWIEMIQGYSVMRQYIMPGEKPQAFFPMKLKPGTVLREYCNLHGLWTYTVQ